MAYKQLFCSDDDPSSGLGKYQQLLTPTLIHLKEGNSFLFEYLSNHTLFLCHQLLLSDHQKNDTAASSEHHQKI